MKLKFILQLVRPYQWSKNLFIFLPMFFNGQLWNTSTLLTCVVVFIAFSFIASSVYCFNDIWDVEADRLHAKKSQRPIASGKISKKEGYLIMIFCAVFSILTLVFFGGKFRYQVLGLITFYYVLNIFYCIGLKNFSIVDVMMIAIGFVLRVTAGGIATEVWLSEWIILMTFLLALFLGFAKRRDDVAIFEATGTELRKNTNKYNLDFMNQVLTVLGTIAIIAYIMYTISPDVINRFHNHYIYLTSIFVLAGFIRYLQIAIVNLKSGSPTDVLFHDRFLQVCIACWFISFLVIIYQ
jgi:4-hydroxybenzoate polyprenyltransferase